MGSQTTYTSVFMAIKPGVLKKASRHLMLGLWRPEPDVFHGKLCHAQRFSWQQNPEFLRRSPDVSSCVYCHQNQMFFTVKWPRPAVFVEKNTGYFFMGSRVFLRRHWDISIPFVATRADNLNPFPHHNNVFFSVKPNQRINPALWQERNRKLKST